MASLCYLARAFLNRLRLDQLAASGDGRTVHITGNVPELLMPDLDDLQFDRRKFSFYKASSRDLDESRIRSHIKPLLGKRLARHLRIADVEAMQTDVMSGKTEKARTGGRGGRATGGSGVAARCVGTLQAILGHAKHKGLLAEHPTKGVKKLAGKKRTRRLTEPTSEQMFGRIVPAACVETDIGFLQQL